MTNLFLSRNFQLSGEFCEDVQLEREEEATNGIYDDHFIYEQTVDRLSSLAQLQLLHKAILVESDSESEDKTEKLEKTEKMEKMELDGGIKGPPP